MFNSDSSSHYKRFQLATNVHHSFSLEQLFRNTAHCLVPHSPLAHVKYSYVQPVSLSEFKMGGDVWTRATVRVPPVNGHSTLA